MKIGCRQLSSTLSALSKRNDALLSNDDVIKPSVVKENVEQALAVVKQTLQGNDEGLRALAAIDESIRAQQQQFETFSPCCKIMIIIIIKNDFKIF